MPVRDADAVVMAGIGRPSAPGALEAAEQTLSRIDRTFFSTGEAADRLGIAHGEAAELLGRLECRGVSARVCRDGWVLTWRCRGELRLPVLTAYLDDMMGHLGVGYYLSYAAAARERGASHHGVMRHRVNVETDDLGSLALRTADGPADLAVSFHPIDPCHGRPVSSLRVLCLPGAGDGPARSRRRTLRVATAETVLLDMVERPQRCGGMDHAATIACKMLFWGLLHPALLAEASDLYEPQVARRTGSMLQHVSGIRHRVPLRHLLRRVRRRPATGPVEMHSAGADSARKPDRWGVTYAHPLHPDL